MNRVYRLGMKPANYSQLSLAPLQGRLVEYQLWLG